MIRTPYISNSLSYAHLLRKRVLSWCSHITLLAFLVNTLGPIPTAQAQEFRLPTPGVMVHLSPPLDPPILKGIKVHPDDPFRFDFILDKGDSGLSVETPLMASLLKQEATKLIKYFLASLTVPETDLWVNLSPYEKNRIIPNSFGLTERTIVKCWLLEFWPNRFFRSIPSLFCPLYASILNDLSLRQSPALPVFLQPLSRLQI